jgi:hypothetical protein
MTTRRVLAVLLAVAVAFTMPACGKRKGDKEKVLGFLHSTQQLAARYVYVDQRFDDVVSGTRGRKIEVQGLREDDFKFKARVLYNGTDGFDEVVADDSLATRFLDPASLGPLVNKDQLAKVDLKTDQSGVSVLDVLRSRRWVLDANAAPSITVGARKATELGKDPVLDALTGLRYVEQAINEAAGVKRWSKDDLDPAYSSSEEDFPQPSDGSGVRRYDLVRAQLPAAVNRSGRDENSFPTTRQFRRMAIYVKDKRIIQVREKVDLRGKRLNDFISYNRAVLKANNVDPRLRKQFDENVKKRPTDAAGELAFGRALLSGLNVTLNGLGIDPVLIRNMTLDFRDLGGPVKVDLPQDETVKGNLDFLSVTDSGKDKAQTGSGGGGGTSSTTTPDATGTPAPGDTTATSAP